MQEAMKEAVAQGTGRASGITGLVTARQLVNRVDETATGVVDCTLVIGVVDCTLVAYVVWGVWFRACG